MHLALLRQPAGNQRTKELTNRGSMNIWELGFQNAMTYPWVTALMAVFIAAGLFVLWVRNR